MLFEHRKRSMAFRGGAMDPSGDDFSLFLGEQLKTLMYIMTFSQTLAKESENGSIYYQD